MLTAGPKGILLLLLGIFLLWISGLVSPVTYAVSEGFIYNRDLWWLDVVSLLVGTSATAAGFLRVRQDVLTRQSMWQQRWRLAKRFLDILVRETAKRPQDALVDYLDSIVRLCRSKQSEARLATLPDKYFWAKIYRYDRGNGSLTAAFVSQSAPPTAAGYHLDLGQGGAGLHAQWAITGLRKGLMPSVSRLYDLKQLTTGLSEEKRKTLHTTGLQTALCAAIFRQRCVITDEGMALQPVMLPGDTHPQLLGILYFCSKVDRNSTHLQRDEEKRYCEEAAAIAGLLMAPGQDWFE